ncbi:MAG: hypothetical protein ACRD3W_25795, partial [Terriglobales bacterium]
RITNPDGSLSLKNSDGTWTDYVEKGGNWQKQSTYKGDFTIGNDGSLTRSLAVPGENGETKIEYTRWNADGTVETADDSLLGGGLRWTLQNPDETAQRTMLEKVADSSIADPQKRARFESFLSQFENRITDPKERAQTYFELSRMLQYNPDAPLSAKQRAWVAEQLMMQIADPTIIDQGSHSTCNVTTVEERLAIRNPSEYAKMIADSVVTGKYVTANGNTIDAMDIGALQRDGEANKAWTQSVAANNSDLKDDGDRSFASKIFQEIAVNILLSQSDMDPVRTGTAVPGSWKLVSQFGTEVLVGPGGVTKPFGGLYGADLTYIYNEITGTDESGFVFQKGSHTGIGPLQALTDVDGRIINPSGAPYRDYKSVFSESMFVYQLEQAKLNGKLPVIITVDANQEPFWTASGNGAAGGSGNGTAEVAGHVVIITDVDMSGAMIT